MQQFPYSCAWSLAPQAEKAPAPPLCLCPAADEQERWSWWKAIKPLPRSSSKGTLAIQLALPSFLIDRISPQQPDHNQTGSGCRQPPPFVLHWSSSILSLSPPPFLSLRQRVLFGAGMQGIPPPLHPPAALNSPLPH